MQEMRWGIHELDFKNNGTTPTGNAMLHVVAMLYARAHNTENTAGDLKTRFRRRFFIELAGQYELV